jgi:hypothetical protein
VRVLRYEVPVNDLEHLLWVAGDIVHVQTRSADYVEFWSLERRNGGRTVERAFQVFGTGHEVPEGLRFVGSAVSPGGTFVWHLFERPGVQCEDHKPVQHRDAKPPWCPKCRLTADFQNP